MSNWTNLTISFNRTPLHQPPSNKHVLLLHTVHMKWKHFNMTNLWKYLSPWDEEWFFFFFFSNCKLSGSLEMHVGAWIREAAQVLPPCGLTFSESILFQLLNAWPLLPPMSLTTARKALLLSLIIVMQWASALPCQDFGSVSPRRQHPLYSLLLSTAQFQPFRRFLTNCSIRIQMKNHICTLSFSSI